uniref:Uncharacterized protein n=1 Tax=Ursus americanus TaxID=9643 RepID=A0A452SIR1_URSAM
MKKFRANKLDNLEEKNKFLEMYNLPKLNHEEIENLNRPITIKEIESVIKKTPQRGNRKPRNKPVIIWSINLGQRQKEYAMGKRQSFQQMVLGKLDSYMQKNETEPPYTINKNKFKMD